MVNTRVFNKPTKQNKSGPLIITAIIIIAIVGTALYFVPKKESETKSAANGELSAEDGDPQFQENGQVQGETKTGALPTNTPTLRVTATPNESTAAVTREYKVFIDKNNNQQRDASELECGLCIAKVLSTTQSQHPQTPNQVIINSNGSLADAEMSNYNLAWGLFDDRLIMIPEFSYSASGDGAQHINIPAYEYKLLVNAVNANYLKAEVSGNKVTYIFKSLLPAFLNTVQANKVVWVRYTPDVNNLNVYYLASGKLIADKDGLKSDSLQGYYLEVTWSNFPNKANIGKIDNLDFVLL